MKRRLSTLFLLIAASSLSLAQADIAKLKSLAKGPSISFSVNSDTGVWAAGMADVLARQIEAKPNDWTLKAKRSSFLGMAQQKEAAKQVAIAALSDFEKADVEVLAGEELFLFSQALEYGAGGEAVAKFLDEIARDLAADPGFWLARAHMALNRSVELRLTADGSPNKEAVMRSVAELIEERQTCIAKACELGAGQEYVMREGATSAFIDLMMGNPAQTVPDLPAKATPDYRLYDLFVLALTTAVQGMVNSRGEVAPNLVVGQLPEPMQQRFLLAAAEIDSLADKVSPELESCALEYGYVAAYFSNNLPRARAIQQTWREEFPEVPASAIATLTLATLSDDLEEAAGEAAEIADEFPEHVEIQSKAGRILERAGEWDASRKCWERAALGSGNGDKLKGTPESRLSLSAFLLRTGTEDDLKGAGELLNALGSEVEQLEPHLQAHYAFLSVIYLAQMGDVEEAREIAKDLVEGHPDDEAYREALKALG